MSKSLTPHDIAKLKQLVFDGCNVMQEISDLREGLSETVKAIAEELDVKPAQINKVIKTSFKANLTEIKEDFQEVEDLLVAIGRG